MENSLERFENNNNISVLDSDTSKSNDFSFSGEFGSYVNSYLQDINTQQDLTTNLGSNDINTESLSPIDKINSDFRKFQIDNIVSQSRNRVREFSERLQSKINNPPIDGGETWWNNISQESDAFKKYNTDLEDAYTKLNSGEFIPKYKDYLPQVDNEDRLARKQTTTDKWVNGLSKFGLKVPVAIVGNTLGSIEGLAEGLSTGELAAVYNNNFTSLMDDLFKKLDSSIPNYSTKEERDYNFFEKMSSANGWANDFLGGSVYTVATIGTEAIMAGITGGASLVGSAGKLALKASARVAGKNFLKNTSKIIKNYNRTIPTSNLAGALNNLRFLYTSAGSEASLEAFDSYHESLDNYLEYYKDSHNGELPSYDEYLKFKRDAIDNSNMVYGANLALVGASNIAQFGSYFGIGTGLNKKLTDILGKQFGLGITRVAEGGGIAYQALKPSRLNKILGTTAMVLKAPIMEGVVEEGGQRVINITSQEWLRSKYDPYTMKKNLNLIDAAYMGLQDTYGTKEGWNEVGIGMLIGAAGGIGRKGVKGRWGSLGLSEFSQMVEEKQDHANLLNDSYSRVTEATNSLFERIARTNQFSNYLSKTEQSRKKGDFHSISQDYETAMFSKMLIDHHTGMLDEGVKDFRRVVENMDTSQLKEEYSLSDSDISKFKTSLIDDFDGRVKLFNKSYNIAKSLDLKKGNKDYTEELAMNIYLGHTAKQRANALAESIADIVGDNGVASYIKATSELSDSVLETGEKLVKTEEELTNLEKSYQDIRSSLQFIDESTLINKEELKDVSSKKVKELNRLKELDAEQRAKLASLMIEKQVLEEKLEDLRNSRSAFSLFYGEDTNNISVVDVIKGLKKLETYRAHLKDKNSELAQDLDNLFHNYIAAIKSAKLYYDVYKGMSSPSFIDIKDDKVNEKEEVAKYKANDIEYSDEFKSYDAYIDSLDNGLSPSAKETLKTLYRVSKSYIDSETIKEDIESMYDRFNNSEVDENTEDDSIEESTIEEDIIKKLRTGSPLNQEQEDYYNNNREYIDDLVEQDTIENGDPIPELEEVDKSITDTPSDALLKYIEQSIEDSHADSIDGGIEERSITIADIKRLKYLLDKENSGKLTPQINEELKDLRNKIRDWVILSGTMVDGMDINDTVSIADLIDEYLSLGKPVKGVSPVKIVEDTSKVETNPNTIRNYDFLQSYDKALIKKTINGYEISNISLNGLLNVFGPEIDVTYKDTKLIPKEGIWNINNIKPNDVYTINVGENDVLFTIGANNTIKIKSSNKDILNNYSPLYIDTSLSNSLYSTLYRKVVEGDRVVLKPLDSDFNNVNIDSKDIYKLKPGDLLNITVDKEDPYNRELISNYNKKPTKENLDNLKNKLLISLNNKDGKIVGVLKGINTKLVAGDFNSLSIKQLRNQIAEGIIKNTDTYSDIKLPVKKVLIGHASLGLEITDDGYNQLLYDIDSLNVDSIKDIGYVLNGVITTRNNTENFEQYPYIADIKKNPAFKESKVPFVIINYQGKKIGYPIIIKNNNESLTTIIKDIDNSEDTIHNKVLKINKVLNESGIDSLRYGLTFLNYNRETIDNILSIVPKYNINIDTFMDKGTELRDLLIGKTQLNIDLRDEAFHSPKIQIDFRDIKNKPKYNDNLENKVIIEESEELKKKNKKLQEGSLSERVIKNKDVIEKVLAPNGKESKLYNDALEYTNNSKEAVNIWYSAYEEDIEGTNKIKDIFSKVYLDENGEPSLKDVLSYIETDKYEDKPLDYNVKLDLLDNIYKIGKSPSELYGKIKNAFYKDGYFKLSKSDMIKSGLYNNEDIYNIFNDESLQKEIQNISGLFTNNYHNGNFEAYNLVDNLNINTTFNIPVDSEVIGLGKQSLVDGDELDLKIKAAVYNSSNIYEFDKNINKVDDKGFIDKYNSDTKFKSYIRDKYMNLQRVPICEVVNDSLEFVSTSNTYRDLVNTILITDENNLETAKNIDTTVTFLNGILANVWEKNTTEVENVVKKLESYFIDFNIDIIGLNEVVENTSREELLSFLNSMNTFIKDLEKGAIDKEYIFNITSSIDYIMGRDDSPAYDYIKKKKEGLLSIFRINQNIDEIEAYKKYSLIKIGDFLYEKINDKDITTEELYNKLYNKVLQNPSLFPSDAFYPSGFNQKNLLKDVNSLREDYKLNDLKRYINKSISDIYVSNTNYNKEDYERLVILNLLYNNRYIKTDNNTSDKLNNITSFTGDSKYLSTNFIGDFRRRILEEKLKNTKLYNKVLRHFYFNNNRIELDSNNPLVLDSIRRALPNDKLFNNFKEYSKFVKNSSLNSLFIQENLKDITYNDLSVLYVNFPEVLPLRDINLKKISDGIYSTPITSDEFVRTREGVFEFYRSIDGNSIYRAVNTKNNNDYINFNVEKATVNNEALKDTDQPTNHTVEINDIVNINTIKNNIDDC